MHAYEKIGLAFALSLGGIALVFLSIHQSRLSGRVSTLEAVAARQHAAAEASSTEDDLTAYAREQVQRISCAYESGPVLIEGAESLTDLPRGYWDCEEPFEDRRVVLSKFSAVAQQIESECAYAFRVSKSDTIHIYPRAQVEFSRVLDVCNRYFSLREAWSTSERPHDAEGEQE